MTVLPNSGCCLQSFTPYLLWDLIFQRNVLSQCSDIWKLLYLKIFGENPSNVRDPMISVYAVLVCPVESGCPVTCEMTSLCTGCGQGGLHGTGAPPEVKKSKASRPPSPVQSPWYAADAQIIGEAEPVKSMQSMRIIIISEI